jgi:hypothetical protein
MKVGILGSLVWDVIYGRDARSIPIEEWGGIAYALAAFDASLDPGWQIVPLIKVGSDLAREAQAFLRTLEHIRPGTRCVEVPVANNRVTLRYVSEGRRCERMSGGVPGWTWAELGPMVRDLDAVYVNFISGFELSLGAARALRNGFRGPLYADLHSLFLGMPQDGLRAFRPLADAEAWFSCFDAVQMNEEEMQQLGGDPLNQSASVLHAGVSLLTVTLGARGAVYFEAPRQTRFAPGALYAADTVRTALIEAPRTETLDPTGCGDVLGASLFSRLLAGEPVEPALRHAVRMASRNAAFRGATGLARHLRGELQTADAGKSA